MTALTLKEAYLAMFALLEELARREGPGSDLNIHLGSLAFLPDGRTADPAAWDDWLAAVQKVRAGQVDARLTLRA